MLASPEGRQIMRRVEEVKAGEDPRPAAEALARAMLAAAPLEIQLTLARSAGNPSQEPQP
jgi:hypothetical protein